MDFQELIKSFITTKGRFVHGDSVVIDLKEIDLVSNNISFELTYKVQDYILVKENLKQYILRNKNIAIFIDNQHLKNDYIVNLAELTKEEYKPATTEITLCN